MIHPHTPVLIGAGQLVRHWRGEGDAPSPQSLRAEAALFALADAGVAAVDRVVVVRTIADSVPGLAQPFGRSENPPGALAAALGLHPQRAIYSRVGGDQPQALVNEAAEAIAGGEAECVLIAGAEATAAAKLAQRQGLALDWSDPPGAMPALEDRGYGPALASRAELAAGLGAPVRTYPLIEQAQRARLGRSRAQHRDVMAAMWAGFSEVAAANPFAQFPVARSAAFLATRSPENYPISDPYLKWDVAQDAVNQGAAVVIASSALADRLGVAAERRVYLAHSAEVGDRLVSERADLSRSAPIERALAGIDPATLDLIDLYSCFPCAVLLAAEALGVEPGSRPLTVTGGLPFFGGPGNSYSLHAIAEMVTRLRGRTGATGLVLANGGYLSKEAAGVYAADPCTWRPTVRHELEGKPVALVPAQGAGVVETYTVPWSKGAPSSGIVFARGPDGRRMMAQSRDPASIAALLDADPIGRPIRFSEGDPAHWTIGED